MPSIETWISSVTGSRNRTLQPILSTAINPRAPLLEAIVPPPCLSFPENLRLAQNSRNGAPENPVGTGWPRGRFRHLPLPCFRLARISVGTGRRQGLGGAAVDPVRSLPPIRRDRRIGLT